MRELRSGNVYCTCTMTWPSARHMAFELSVRMSSNPVNRAGTTPTVVFTPVTVQNVARNVNVATTPRVGVPTSTAVPTRQAPRVIARTVSTSTPTGHSGGTPNLGSADAKSKIPKVYLKAVSRSSKKDTKTFVLRNIDDEEITTVAALKNVIKKQLEDDIISGAFDVGVMQGALVVNVRSQEDLKDVWTEARKGGKVVLWCDALKEVQLKKSRHRITEDESDSDDESHKSKRKKSASKEREGKVQETVDTLKRQHGESAYTPMQYRIWSEMLESGLHTSYDHSPQTTMFQRAGGKETPRRRSESATEMAVQAASQAIASALTPKVISSPSSSPGKVIDNRSKCYKQLGELKNLRSSGVLSQEEYESEKQAVMDVLKKLSQ